MALEVMAKARAPIPLAVDLRVAPGEIMALVGPSGAGKSTVLRLIAGLWTPPAGRVRVDSETWLDTGPQAGRSTVNLPPHRRRLGMVFQDYALFPHMTAAQNVMAAMDRADAGEAARLLDLMHLGGLGDRYPAQLSGGQRQRVALARALARRPRVLLLDEPFSAVDQATRAALQAQVAALRGRLDMPVVLVTHDLGEAQRLADRMAVLQGGRVLAQGSVAQVMADAPALRALGIRELAAMLPATVTEHLPDGLSRLDSIAGPLFLPGVTAAPGQPVQVRIMAHDVILSRARPEGLSAQNILPGRVARVVPGAGPGMMVHVTLGGDGDEGQGSGGQGGAGEVGVDRGGHEIIARITRRAADQMALQTGQPVHAILTSLSVARDQLATGSVVADGGKAMDRTPGER